LTEKHIKINAFVVALEVEGGEVGEPTQESTDA